MPKMDSYELEVPSAFEKGRLKSVATKAELAKFKAAARATAIKDRRVNIRLSSGDLSDIQVKAADVEPCGSPAPTFRRVIVAGVSFPAHRGGQTMKPLPNISVIVTAAACSLLFNLPETSFAQEAASPAAQAWIDVATFSGLGMPMGGMGGIGAMFGGKGGGDGNVFGNTRTMGAGRWVDVTVRARANPGLDEARQAVPEVFLSPALELRTPKNAPAAARDDEEVKHEPVSYTHLTLPTSDLV